MKNLQKFIDSLNKKDKLKVVEIIEKYIEEKSKI